MAGLSLRHVEKIYPGNVKAVHDFNLEIQDKEFLVFVGPSGCGKSTTLRMIAGLEEISNGELYINNKLVNDIEPKDRDIAMVFQNYALYPHMSVRDNMAFGLKMHKVDPAEITKRVTDAATMLELTDYLDRKPKALSGGQRQRVALGRAMVRDPQVFLLDEPLSNLDAKLRVAMRTEISKLHKRLETTFIYVTHDQTEAMTMGTRIVVMKDGLTMQVDTPQNLYQNPANKFVAEFIGSPQMNIFKADLVKQGDALYAKFDDNSIEVTGALLERLDKKYIGKKVYMGLRPENFYSEDAWKVVYKNSLIKIKVDIIEEMGSDTYLYYSTPSCERNVTARVAPTTTAKAGETIELGVDTSKLCFFDIETDQSILSN